MSNRDTKARELCEAGLRKMWESEVEPALDLYSRALEIAKDEELREMITIRKAEALIAANIDGPEIPMLAQIVMRRRTPRHVYLAALALMRRYVEYETAKPFGRRALALASVDRQVRNANYLLGRIASAAGEYDEAAQYFEVVAGYYSEYPNCKELLMTVDVSRVVNWKA